MVKKTQLRKMLVKRERSLILGFHALCNRPHWLTVPISISLKLEWRCGSSSECVAPELSLSRSSSECMTLSCWIDCWNPPANTPLLDCLCDWNNRGVLLFAEVWETGTLKRAGRTKWSLFPLDSGHEAKPAQLFLLNSVTCCCRCSLLSSYHDLGVPLPLCGVSPIELQTKPDTLKLHLLSSTQFSCLKLHHYVNESFRHAQMASYATYTWTDTYTYRCSPGCSVNCSINGFTEVLEACTHRQNDGESLTLQWAMEHEQVWSTVHSFRPQMFCLHIMDKVNP